jgi:quercetin dioxygenase-like cupin family protein/catechol 2,3-dioxygenase-like lactoylglutathione lyase family enzyme
MKNSFPEIIRELPEADIPFEGVRAYISQSASHQILYMEFENDIEVPEHSHGAQWGIVVEGEIELTIDGDKRTYHKGDHYFIPEGTIHSAKIRTGYSDVTFFAEPCRYKKKEQSGTISIRNIDHIVLTVKDIQKTCEFYSEAFRMEVVEFGKGRKALTFGKQKINLHEHGNELEPKAASAAPGTADICLITETPISIFISHLEKKGIDIIDGPVERNGAFGKIESIYIRDPDGNLVEVSNYICERSGT